MFLTYVNIFRLFSKTQKVPVQRVKWACMARVWLVGILILETCINYLVFNGWANFAWNKVKKCIGSIRIHSSSLRSRDPDWSLFYADQNTGLEKLYISKTFMKQGERVKTSFCEQEKCKSITTQVFMNFEKITQNYRFSDIYNYTYGIPAIFLCV